MVDKIKNIDWFFMLVVPWVVAACLLFPIVTLGAIFGIISWWTGLVSGSIICIGLPVSVVYYKCRR